jgi:hypothetical protein
MKIHFLLRLVNAGKGGEEKVITSGNDTEKWISGASGQAISKREQLLLG